ncbi:MAG: aromatic ring-hydroxylating dioxygenase subunit alpha [Oceanicola sp.]|nr:aromatic ring-hydroxylating dioxygenase subunit alpha [Oceanicola sp.]
MPHASPLDAVLADVETARGLPNAHYVDPAMFEEERRKVLFANWAGIGFGKDVPEPGDAKPVDFLGVPLLLVRDETGTVHVYQNTCRHRGMILVDSPRNIRGAIRCPYHSWCYTLQGNLRTTPHVGGPGKSRDDNIDRAALGLIRIASAIWQDVVFVNIDGQAPPFEEVHADLLTRWRNFNQPVYAAGGASSFKLEVQTNWKLAVENYCESYHLPWVHPGLNSYSRLEDHYNIERRGEYSGQGSLVYRQIETEDGTRFPDFEGLDGMWDTGAEYVAVYPNVLLGVHRDHTFAILLEPVALDRTIEHVEIYYARPPEALAPDLLARNAEQWKLIFEEDIFVVEGMQKGRNGLFFDGGKFSPAMDGPTHTFHHWVASCLQPGAPA